MKKIRLRGVRTHNLKDIQLDIPRDKLVVITGLSGSGKSSLAFDTIYAEGQRRYVESLSAYARQFLSVMDQPDVDVIEGLSPTIAIEQKSTSHNPRSTVGTITEIYDYLRLLYARIGEPRCPVHQHVLQAQTISQMVDHVLALSPGALVMILAPVWDNRKGDCSQLLARLKREGFIRIRLDGKLLELDDVETLDARKKHTIDVVVDRLKIRPDMQQRLAESFETAVRMGEGVACMAPMEDQSDIEEHVFSTQYACISCGYSLSELEPRLFSFNNPAGACPTCDGLGVKQYFDPEKVIHHADASIAAGAVRGWNAQNKHYYQVLQSLSEHYNFDMNMPYCKLSPKIQHMILYGSAQEKIPFLSGGRKRRAHPFEGVIPLMERRYKETQSTAVRDELSRYLKMGDCSVCGGARLKVEACHVFIEEKNLPDITALSIDHAYAWLRSLSLSGKRGKIAEKIVDEIKARLQFLIDVGLDYLNLARGAETLSGGEAQRIRLASQIGSGLVGVLYILDEPSIGLHQRDNQRLLDTLIKLRDLGNSVIVVEHDEAAMRAADYMVEMGPGAGVHGGEVVAQGTPASIMRQATSLTAEYLLGRRKIPIPEQRVAARGGRPAIQLKGASCHNLKNVSVDIPIGVMTCVTGVSGSGKSSLINDTLYPIIAERLNRAFSHQVPTYRAINGLEHIDKIIKMNQAPIGRTPRSNPVTYTGIFTLVRELFAETPEARARGYRAGRFSFNVPGGRCEACEGDGVIRVEMHFLSDVYVHCDDCFGKRYNRETLEIRYKGKNIHEVLQMTVEEARTFFDPIPPIARKLQTLIDVGLAYITLGQSATTLSGGEAQRIKLARELAKREIGRTLYLLDEPTTGLHFHDILQLLKVLQRLRDQGNTIIIIEHNLDVIKVADWIIDMGPEGGDGGGEVMVAGTPEIVAACKASYTGQFLKPLLKKGHAQA